CLDRRPPCSRCAVANGRPEQDPGKQASSLSRRQLHHGVARFFEYRGARRNFMKPLVTIVTPTTGNPCVARALESVSRQSYKNIQHLVFVDNPQCSAEMRATIREYGVDLIELPYATGKERFNGHRIYGAS